MPNKNKQFYYITFFTKRPNVPFVADIITETASLAVI